MHWGNRRRRHKTADPWQDGLGIALGPEEMPHPAQVCHHLHAKARSRKLSVSWSRLSAASQGRIHLPFCQTHYSRPDEAFTCRPTDAAIAFDTALTCG